MQRCSFIFSFDFDVSFYPFFNFGISCKAPNANEGVMSSIRTETIEFLIVSGPSNKTLMYRSEYPHNLFVFGSLSVSTSISA